MRVHYYFVHTNGGRMVTLDTSQFDFLKSEGWKLDSEWHPSSQKESAEPEQSTEPEKRRPGRPRRIVDEHGTADH